MPNIASRPPRFTRRLMTAALAGLVPIAAISCGALENSPQDTVTTCADPNACGGCGDPECNAGFCLCTNRFMRCFDEKQTVHNAILRANIAMRSDYACKPSADVRAGYRAAFVDVALGGSGTPPPVPPERYWSVCYRTADGHAKAQNWFAGYQVGASRALQTCRQFYNQVPSSGQTAFPTDGTVWSASGPPALTFPAGSRW